MARDSLRGLSVARRPANGGALHYAHAVTYGRVGRSRDAAERFAAGDDALSQLPWLRSLLRLFALEAAVVDGWGDPVPALRADLAEHERAGELQLARTCRDLLRRAGVPTRRGRGESVVPPGMRAVGVTSRELDVLTQLVAERTSRSPRGSTCHPAPSRPTSPTCSARPGPSTAPSSVPSLAQTP